MTGSRPTSNEEHYVLVPASQLQRARSPRRVMLAITLVAAIAAVGVGTGTFASFSASTNNDNNVFSTGTIKLGNKVDTGSVCFSGYTGTGTGSPQSNLNNNDNASCQAVVNVTAAKPGATPTATNLTISNEGDYNGLLKLWLPGGCVAEVVASPAGSLDLCDKLEVYIQETNSSFVPSTTTCVFPAAAGSACSTTWGGAADNDDTLNDLASAATISVPFPSAGISIAAGATKYYKVAFRFPDGGFVNGNGADNGYQNKRAAFDLTWRLQEAA